jgi:hypothetical protein
MNRIGLILVSLVLLGLLAACSPKGRNARIHVYEISMDDIYTPADSLGEEKVRVSFYSAEERISAMRLMAEDDRVELWYCNRVLGIAVRDKSTGEVWLSAPYDLERDTRASSDTQNTIQSLLQVVFFDRQQNERRMNSFSDAVMHGQFGYRSIENGVEVQILVGQLPELQLVPPAAEANSFEELVINQISDDRDRRRLLAYYTRYSWGNLVSQSVKDTMLKSFPGLQEHDLYILRSVNERELRILEELIRQTTYSWDDFQRDMEIAGFEVDMANLPVFKITVSFTLDKGDLVVNLPSGLIDYDKSMYTLGRIHLLEFFGAGRSDNDGYMFIPDGSGVLINFNSDATKPVSRVILPVYGEDVTFTSVSALSTGAGTSSRFNLRNAARFPVFGLREGDKAWLAVIEEGEAMADIIAQSGKFFSDYETVSPALYYRRDYLSIRSGDRMGVYGSFRYIDNNFYNSGWAIRYIFLTGSDADYNGMALAYRQHLIDREILKPLENPNPAIYLDVLGLLQKTDTFMGIPYSRRIRLTTFEQAERILNEMNHEGVKQIVLRYRGWFNGGLDHTVPKRLSIERALGGRKGLESLIQTAKSLSFDTFFEADFNFVRRLGVFSGYHKFTDGSQTIDGYMAEALPFEIVSNAGIEGWSFYTISPNRHKRLFSNFTREVAKSGINLSVSSVGTNLIADYHRRHPVNLQQSRDIWPGSLSEFSDSLGKVVVDGGNAYTLPFTDHIMSIPIAGSSHINTDTNIPFMQLALHGFINYSGPTVNMSLDPELALLMNAEYGASPAFIFAYNNIAELKDTPYSFFYSADYHAWEQLMVDMYHRFTEIYNGLANIPMKRHDRLTEGVYMTTFENDRRVLVNYNREARDVSMDGIVVTLAPRSIELR